MSKQPISDKLVSIFGALLLLALTVSSWVPQPCPLLRQALGSCPPSGIPELTPAQAETARIPHQTIPTEYGTFSILADPDLSSSTFRFAYRLPGNQASYLEAKVNGSYVALGTVSNPLLAKLAWPAVSDTEGYRLYQRDGAFTTISDYLAGSFASTGLIADKAAAAHFNLPPGSYQPLESAPNLDGVNYLLANYSPSTPDGSWLNFTHAYNLSSLKPDADNKLSFAIHVPQASQQNPLLLGTVHVDFAIRP